MTHTQTCTVGLVLPLILSLCSCSEPAQNEPETTTDLESQIISIQERLDALESTNTFRIVSGTVRRIDTNTWGTVEDAAHSSIGISSVVYLSDRVRVNFDFTADKIHGVTVTADETLAKNDIRVGTSVGVEYMDIFIYQGNVTTPVDPKNISNPNANIWIQGDFTVLPEE